MIYAKETKIIIYFLPNFVCNLRNICLDVIQKKKEEKKTKGDLGNTPFK